jgi:uncharacterized protein (TIGR03000 family)
MAFTPFAQTHIQETAMLRKAATAGWALWLALVTVQTLTAQEPEKKAPGEKAPQDANKKKATLRVFVPPLAELEIEGYKTKSTGEMRVFSTPPLETGRKFTYTLKVSWMEGARRVTRMAVAEVRGGEETMRDLRPGSKDDASSRIVFVPTAEKIVEKMLELAEVKKDDVVYDLGCGDGRIVIMAAKKYGAKGVGIDIDPVRVKEAREAVEKAGVQDLVTIRQGDALKVDDLDKATVVTLYMLPEFQEKLRPILQKTLKPGARIVAHDYDLGDWRPAQRLEVQGAKRPHVLFLWRIEPPKK